VISKAELEQYETTLRSAQSNYNAARQNIRSLQAGVQSSQTGLTKANKDLGRTTIVAPMDGVISSLKIKKGESVAGNSFNVGTEMMTVADMAVLEVRVNVGENDIVKINIGDSADVEVDAYNNRKFKGIVTKIASSTASTSVMTTSNDVTNYEVRIRLDKDSYKDLADRTFPFRPGMNASADIKTKRIDNTLSVPISAVNARVKGSDKSLADKKEEDKKSRGEDVNAMDEQFITGDELEEVVFVLQPDNKVKRVVVKSGIQDINYIQVLSGLKAGHEVVVGPYAAISEKLKDGMLVKVVPKDELFEKKK
jgi:HlyD family secretion protein